MRLGRVFVDTGAWFAIQVTDDANHETARLVLPAVVHACRSLVTSNVIVGETYTLAFDSHFATAGFLRIPGDVRVSP